MEDATLATSQMPTDLPVKTDIGKDDSANDINEAMKGAQTEISGYQTGSSTAVLSETQANYQAKTGPTVDYEQSLVVDSQDSDADSSMGDSLTPSTMSLRSSLEEYVEENGRTYHKYKQGRYYLPNDEFEQDRLDLQHHLFTLTFDGNLNLAPIKNPQLVLDIGTGTGIWAMDFASMHPAARVIGTDLSAIQPDFVPPNCQFQVDDAEDYWTFNEKFDYIHGRALFTCFKDHLKVFQSAYDALIPGGYLELQEAHFKPCCDDGSMEGSTLEAWTNLLIDTASKAGRDWLCAVKYKDWLVEAGFEDVVEHIYYWPSNQWPKGKKNKTLGLWAMTDTLDAVGAISMALMTRVLGMPPEEVELMCMDVRKDMKDKSIHAYYPLHVVYGRKPLAQ